jgi:hypothetical protein
MINEINLTKQTCHTKTIRNINKNTIKEFPIKFHYKLWDNGNNVDISFHSFPNSYLRIFYSSFPTENLIREPVKKPWITNEIEVMCQHKKAVTEAKKSLV